MTDRKRQRIETYFQDLPGLALSVIQGHLSASSLCAIRQTSWFYHDSFPTTQEELYRLWLKERVCEKDGLTNQLLDLVPAEIGDDLAVTVVFQSFTFQPNLELPEKAIALVHILWTSGRYFLLQQYLLFLYQQYSKIGDSDLEFQRLLWEVRVGGDWKLLPSPCDLYYSEHMAGCDAAVLCVFVHDWVGWAEQLFDKDSGWNQWDIPEDLGPLLAPHWRAELWV
jgi:hypothetical protein